MNTPTDIRQVRFEGLERLYPNLHAAVAYSFAGSARRTEFFGIRAFPEGFETKCYTGTVRGEAELRLGLAAIMDESNWKLPFDRRFDRLRDYERDLVTDAAVWYCGTIPEFKMTGHTGRSVRVVGSGYYAEIGA